VVPAPFARAAPLDDEAGKIAILAHPRRVREIAGAVGNFSPDNPDFREDGPVIEESAGLNDYFAVVR
jgi:hypothetical protein